MSAVAWKKTVIRLRVRGAHGPEWMPVSGYSDGTFGLDRRPYLDDAGSSGFGYCVTHLRTGFVVRYVRDTLPNAKAFVAAIRTADWEFDDPEQAKADGNRPRVVIRACGQFATSDGTDFFKPEPAEEQSA
jgi:hypothetical protein